MLAMAEGGYARPSLRRGRALGAVTLFIANAEE